MRRACLIAWAELALMVRSRVALIGVIALLLLSTIAAATSYAHMAQERLGRIANQTETDALFEAQPARHPHRMVHYGSYVYRPIGTLAGFDPGIDPFSGTTLYLEGHRQNSATISAVRENSSLMRFGQLTPAFVLQTLAPLLLVVFDDHARAYARQFKASSVFRCHSPGYYPRQNPRAWLRRPYCNRPRLVDPSSDGHCPA
jgi:ABC-2 type transport system permease protein